MNRVAAGLLLWTLFALWAPALPLHVHASAAHPHPEHRHGLSAHAHHHGPERAPRAAQAPADVRGEREQIEACTPEAHSLAAMLVATVAGQMVGDGAVELAARFTIAAPPVARVTPARADVRAHGPPPSASVAPRAPPPPRSA